MAFQIASKIADHRTQVKLDVNMNFLNNLSEEVGFEPFCEAVWEVLKTSCPLTEKIDLLMDVVHRRADLLSDKLVLDWMTSSRDEVLANIIWESFARLKTAHDLSKEVSSSEIWVIKQMLSVLRVMAPEQNQSFAALVLEKYPNIYGVNKSGELFGLAKHLRALAGDQTPKRFFDYIASVILKSKTQASHAGTSPADADEVQLTKNKAANRVIEIAAMTEAERLSRQEVKKSSPLKKSAKGQKTMLDPNAPFAKLADIRDQLPPAAQSNGANGAAHTQ